MVINNKKGFIKYHAFDWSTKKGNMRVTLALFEDRAEIDTIQNLVTNKEIEKPKSIGSKIKDYAKAEASLFLEGEVDKNIYKSRIKICKECKYFIKTTDSIGHCNKCGCGKRKRAGLSIKCKMPKATCPVNKW
tara:strand:+ start:1428 stop:1826 length:399 start_codon:yes stop_codon:yes gene_type:complete